MRWWRNRLISGEGDAMVNRDLWEEWVHSGADPIVVESRPHTAEEVRDAIEAAALAGTSRGLRIGICAGLALGACLALLFWVLYSPKPVSTSNVNQSELRRLQAENERLQNQPVVTCPKCPEPPVAVAPPAAETQKEEERAAGTEEPKEETGPIAASPPKTRPGQKPKEKPQRTRPASTYTCRDGRTVKNPSECEANQEPPDTYICGDGSTMPDPAACRPKGG